MKEQDNGKITLAIVEDDQAIREGMKMLIEGFPGYACVGVFSNGEDAVRELPKLKPDVILMDINLPEMSGIECMIQLKKLKIPSLFITLTILEDSEKIFEALSAGSSGYLLKDTPPSKILEAVETVYRGGSPMSDEIARKVVDYFQRKDNDEPPELGLTSREEDIISLLAKGYLYKEIGDQLHISIDTVRTHIRHIYEKLQVRTRSEAILKYFRK